MPMPMPNSAVTIGRPIASTEPNATSRMMTAASRPERLGGGRLHAVGEDVTAELDGEPGHVHLGPDRSHAVGDRTPLVEVEVDGVHLRVGDRAVFRDLVLALRRVRAHDAGHARHLCDLGEHRLHRGLDLRVGHPLLGLEHDRAAVTWRAGSATRAGRTRAGSRCSGACRRSRSHPRTRDRTLTAATRVTIHAIRTTQRWRYEVRAIRSSILRTLSPAPPRPTRGGCDLGHVWPLVATPSS